MTMEKTLIHRNDVYALAEYIGRKPETYTDYIASMLNWYKGLLSEEIDTPSDGIVLVG